MGLWAAYIMVFSSIMFLCVFLPIFYILHLLSPNIKLKNAVLIIASLVFYAFGEPIYILLLLASTLFHYLIGIYLSKESASHPRLAVTLVIVVNILILSVFKYSAFFIGIINSIFKTSLPIPNIRLPIGISFFTFQIMSYIFDVYKDKSLSQKNFFNVLLYIMLFPQLIAGPIVKYHDIEKEITSRSVTAEKTAKGIERFVCGLAKKIIISNTLAIVVEKLFNQDIGNFNMPIAWLATISYSFQIYFDFSGYSDMAIGLGKMFGFTFLENFNYPYSSLSMREFWRRWHISLSTWFKEYLYIPLGGNRKGKLRTAINRIIVFFLTGLWHGANYTFVVWGLYHGFFLLLEEYQIIPIDKLKSKPLKNLYTLIISNLGFVIFRAESLTQAFAIIKSAFFGYDFSDKLMSIFFAQLSPYFIFILALAFILSYPISKKLADTLSIKPKIDNSLRFAGSLALLGFCLMSLASGSFNPFIYFQF